MERSQADEVAQAILEPSVKAQAEDRRRLEMKAGRAAAHRRQSLYFIAGYVVGAAVGYFVFDRISLYGVAGGFVGVLVGALVARFRRRVAA